MIVKKSKNYLIIRMPEIIGRSKNPYTLTNFFFKKLQKTKSFYFLKILKEIFLRSMMRSKIQSKL